MTQFEKDLRKPMAGAKSLGIYNLLITKRDTHLYCVGVKPNKAFKISNVKKYFGIKGNKFNIDTQLRRMANRELLGEYDLTNL